MKQMKQLHYRMWMIFLVCTASTSVPSYYKTLDLNSLLTRNDDPGMAKDCLYRYALENSRTRYPVCSFL